MNRKGAAVGQNLFALPWFLLFIVTLVGGIVGAKYLFLGSGYDAYEIESEALNYRMRTCLEQNDALFSSDFNVSVFEKCGLYAPVLVDHLILLRNLDTNESYFVGVRDFETRCDLPAKDVPACVKSYFVHNDVSYELVTAARQESKKVFG